ncbi:MAG TPA: hypothetical protein VGG72_01380 [Bryobacteraceae bacterium]|jgi:hypothetical protein
MDTPAQGTPAEYVWEAAGKGFQIHIRVEVIDALFLEIMRGFGAVPKRGAEVGGLLIGSIETGATTIVRIEDFEPLQCGYTRGPSYLLSEDETQAFDDTVERWRPDDALRRSSPPGSTPQRYAVGFYRSHTRDGLTLAPEDLELMARNFPDPSHVVLLVKPFVTKASPAGFFFREGGEFQKTTPLEFPFRRFELTGEEPPEHRPLTEKKQRVSAEVAHAAPETAVDLVADRGYLPSPSYQAPDPGMAYSTPPRSGGGGWTLMIPLSFVFLLLGVALGYLAALNVGPRGISGVTENSLSMVVTKTGDTLSLRWNGESPLLRKADRGVLEIHDGEYAKVIDLDATQIRNGNIIFPHKTDRVSFRLTAYLSPNLSVSGNLDWHQ